MQGIGRAFLAALSIAAAACSVTSGSGPDNPAIDDPATLTRLGVAEPGPVIWSRAVGPADLVGLTSRADPDEVDLVAAALTEIPTVLLDAAGVRNLVRSAGAEDTELHPATTAFARGPDIYLLDRTFRDARAGTGRLSLARILTHELAHVAQFGALEADYVDAILSGEITETDTSNGSALVADFAAATGWSDSSTQRFSPSWRLASTAGTTEYGATAPDEDMAESISLVAVGRANLISTERVRWVENWLGVSSAQLSLGKPWVPDGSSEAFFDQAVYDEAGVAELRARHVEPQYFVLPASAQGSDEMAAQVSSQLRRRGITGTLAPVLDNRLPRYSGVFARSDGVRFWVELWDFRSSTGFRSPPPGPVLTYVTLW